MTSPLLFIPGGVFPEAEAGSLVLSGLVDELPPVCALPVTAKEITNIKVPILANTLRPSCSFSQLLSQRLDLLVILLLKAVYGYAVHGYAPARHQISIRI